MGIRAALRRRPSKDIVYAPAQVERKGFEYSIPDTGIGEYDQGIGSPAFACIGSLLLWIVVFPWYLAIRSRIRAGIQGYLSPVRAQPRDPQPLNGQYRIDAEDQP